MKAIWSNTNTSTSHAAFTIDTIDQVIDDSECVEMIVDPVDMIPYGYLEKVLIKLFSKIRHGGVIYLTGTSFSLLSKAYLTKSYERKEFGNILQKCSNLYDLQDVENIVRGYGLAIEDIVLEGLKFTIRAGRP